MPSSKDKRRLMVNVNVARCLGCRSCELACAVAHSVARELEAVARSGQKPGYRITVEASADKAVPLHCNHCEQAACVLACPTGAIWRESETGPVLCAPERCIGCKMCVQACPFGVIALRPDGKGVLKCDLCGERLAAGEQPACVVACPTGALVFAEETAANRAKRRKAAARLAAAQEE
jgi:carbon-monoxide dehydrogenase iron sulfur subunit